MRDYIFTSESVSEGHPDKVCDRISDEIVDMFISQDKFSRTAVETVTTTDYVGLIGEIRSEKSIDHNEIDQKVRDVISKIGYEQEGFNAKDVTVDIRLHKQSADIAMGVDASEEAGKDEGAGDQGLMFGYACRETDALMPAPIFYSHAILRLLSEARHKGEITDILPDSKSQLTLEYKNGIPVRAESIVVSTQHSENLSQEKIREIVRPIVEKALPEGWMCSEDRFLVNPTGRFVIGGPVGDSGLTGRKIIVDTYGGAAPHGGGAFSGKDPTKVDRSAAYAARYLAKNIVSAGYADKCTIQLSYAIGISEPVSLYVDTHGTGKLDEQVIENAISKVMDLTPGGIRKHLELNRPIYARTSAYGHFGRDVDADGGFSWERTDLAEKLRNIIGE